MPNYKNRVDIQRIEALLQNRLGPEPQARQIIISLFLHTLKNKPICNQIGIETDPAFASSTTCSILQSQKWYCTTYFPTEMQLPTKITKMSAETSPINMLTLLRLLQLALLL